MEIQKVTEELGNPLPETKQVTTITKDQENEDDAMPPEKEETTQDPAEEAGDEAQDVLLNQDVNLQKCFAKFRKKTIRRLKRAEKLKTISLKNLDRNSPEYHAKLREKFVETAKQYLGIPYSKKYMRFRGE
jgi:hypothetical protein